MCVDIKKELTDFCGKDLSLASDQEIYYGLLKLIQKRQEKKYLLSKEENFIIFPLNF